ncbi:hypothetical protein [Streptomyces scopuliridis]|uniref:hypothetical protein n=1 Tax=Streptomyces scopuliridis TaxID=452529 RepID=UPI0036AABC31
MSQYLSESPRRHLDAKCDKTARVTKYGSPYTLIGQQVEGHSGQCRDIDNGLWFEPDAGQR